jgi:hypothetical protein
MSGRLRFLLAITIAALPALAGAALLLGRVLGGTSTPTAGETLPAALPPPAVYARELCSFSNGDAREALVQGADGGFSVAQGGKTWWFFGDTLFLAASGKQIEQNAIAWSDGVDDHGCPALHYHAQDGVAVPFIPKDGSLTVWPVGAWPRPDGRTIDAYTAYVYGSGPYAYRIGEVGVATLDTATMMTTIGVRSLWDDTAGFPDHVIGAQPVEVGPDALLRVVLQTQHSQKYLARVAPERIADAAAYEYWDGERWQRSPASAASLWPGITATDPVQRLAQFENGASIAWNESLHAYVAVVNVGFAAIGIRTAARLEGPWSAAQPLIDCTLVARPSVPVCYSPYQHPSVSPDGRTLVLTFTRMATYDTVAFEVHLGDAVHEYERDGRYAYEVDAPGEGWRDRGIVAYAAAEPAPGLAPVYRWRGASEGDRYGVNPPDGEDEQGGVAFYAPATPLVSGAAMTYTPVYEWSRDGRYLLSPPSDVLQQLGYQRGRVAFYASAGSVERGGLP